MKLTTYVTPKHICTPNCFRVFRNNEWCKTRECNRKIASESIADHRRIKATRELWLGEKGR